MGTRMARGAGLGVCCASLQHQNKNTSEISVYRTHAENSQGCEIADMSFNNFVRIASGSCARCHTVSLLRSIRSEVKSSTQVLTSEDECLFIVN